MGFSSGFCHYEMLSQGFEFPTLLFEVFVLVVTRCGRREQTNVTFLGMDSNVGKGFFHGSIIK